MKNKARIRLSEVFSGYSPKILTLLRFKYYIDFTHYMDSVRHSGNEGDSPHRWARILGTIVAIVTVTLPVVMVAYYSPSKSNAEPLPEEVRFYPESQGNL